MSKGSQAAQGAAGGALAGAGTGAMFGPWGAVIGAGIGGIAGGLSGYYSGDPQEEYRSQLDQLRAKWGGWMPQAGPAAQAGYSQFRQNQMALISQLEAMARGEGPSAAAMQMREAMDRAAGAQAGAAAGAGGRGVNAGAAFRTATNNTAAIQAQGARDTATIRAQEQIHALGQLGETVGRARWGDESMQQFNANEQNQQALANLQAQLSALGITSEAQLKALMAAMGSAGPGMGTQILAGGAQAYPSLLQYASARGKNVDPNGAAGGGRDNAGNQHVGGYDSQGNGYGYGGYI